jgi:hypothetical protein
VTDQNKSWSQKGKTQQAGGSNAQAWLLSTPAVTAVDIRPSDTAIKARSREGGSLARGEYALGGGRE